MTFVSGKAMLLTTMSAAIAAVSSQAAVVTFVGSDITTNAAWRDSSVSKPLSLGGSDLYGSSGYVLFATSPTNTATTGGYDAIAGGDPFNVVNWNDRGDTMNTLKSVPAGISFTNVRPTEILGGNWCKVAFKTYANAGPLYLNPAYKWSGASSGWNGDVLTLAIGAGAPSNFRIGFIAVGSGSSDKPDNLYFNGVHATIAADNTAGPTYYFFDVSSAGPGDTAKLQIWSPAGHSNLYGMTFDVVPEPAMASLLGIAGMGAMTLRRRRIA